MTRIRLLSALLAAVALAGCEQDAIQIDDITAPATGAWVKFFNFGVGAPQVNFYAGDRKVTAVSSTTGAESTVGVAYGGAAAGGVYTAIPAGQVTFAGRISATVDNNLAISAIPGTLVEGKAYSVYLSGSYDAAAKRSDGFVVEDNLPAAFDDTQALVRLVNASHNSPAVQLFVRNPTTLAETPVGAAVAYKAGGAFVGVPSGGYDLVVRAEGATAALVTRTAVAFSVGRIYTITLRGDATLPSTGTSANRPILDNTLNR
jgi:hypothetical protein